MAENHLRHAHDVYLIGKGIKYAAACEIALKLKEISYLHAEGLVGGELKHGTLALIEDGVPVIYLVSDPKESLVNNVSEVLSRVAIVISISPHGKGLYVRDSGCLIFPLYATTLGFLLTDYIALEKNLPIDKPRNLTKSVTVV